MAKRFYDTGLVDQEWYMELSPKLKALYVHLLCKCDIAGVFEVNYRMMSMYVNDTVTEEDVFGAFGNRIVPLANSTSKGIIVDFIGFQCGGCVNPRVKAHASILKRLKELGLSLDDIIAWTNHPLRMADEQTKEERKEEEKKIPSRVIHVSEIIKEGNDTDRLFDEFWALYPRHDAKKVARAKFDRIMSESKNMNETLKCMIASIRKSKSSEQWTKEGGKFIPMPATWLNQMRWEDEGVVNEEEMRKEKEMSAAEMFGASLTI